MLIEVDHMSERARERVLTIAARHDYPLVSSHTGTGGSWTGGELRRLYRTGGFASATPADAAELAAKILRFRHFRDRGRYFGVGLGTDTGGFSSLPGPRRRRTRSTTRSAPIAAMSCSRASAPASAASTSTTTASPTTACSPTC